MQFIKVFIFCIFCVSCINEKNRLPSYSNNIDYTSQALLSFKKRSSYSIKSLILPITRSSLFTESLNQRNSLLLSVSSLVLSDYIERGLRNYLNLSYNQVKSFRLEYLGSDPYRQSREVRASGLVMAPSTRNHLPVLIYFHPTLLDKDEAPSLLPPSTLTMNPLEDYRLMLIFLAMQGYIVISPDQIGYGSSEDKVPPYLHKRSIVQSSSEFLKAVIQALYEKNIAYQKKIFIMGYSQGGHSALAFAEALQNSSIDIDIQAISAGGGPYDILYTVQEQLDQNTIVKVAMAPLLQSYSYIYNWNLHDIIKRDTYADQISQAYRKDNLLRAVEDLPSQTNSLFEARFLREIQSRDGYYHPFLEENSAFDWSPQSPVLLFHLRNDHIVPDKNMEFAYRSFKSRRRSEIEKMNCTFKKVKDLTQIIEDFNKSHGNHIKIEPNHVNCSFIFFLETGDYFLRYRNNY